MLERILLDTEYYLNNAIITIHNHGPVLWMDKTSKVYKNTMYKKFKNYKKRVRAAIK